MLLYQKLGHRARVILAAIFWAGYIAAFPFLYQVLGDAIAMLSLLPVSGTAWIFGARWGLLISILSIPINVLLDYQVTDTFVEVDSPILVLGSVITLVAAFIIGRLTDLTKQLNDELQLRREIETALQYKAEEVEHQKRYFEALVQSSPIAIVSLTPDQKIQSCNPAFEKLFGYREEDVLDQDLDPLVAKGEYFQDAAEISRKVQAGMPIQTSGKRTTKDGSALDMDIFGVPVIIDDIQVGILGQYLDVTDKKRAEAALESQLHFLQTIIDVIPFPVLYKDTNLRYLGCNAAFEELVGKPKVEIIVKRDHDILPKETADIFTKLDLDLLEVGGIQISEERVSYLDGTIHDVLLHKATFNDIDGNLAGLISARVDITDLKQKERALLESEERFRSIFEFSPEGVIISNTTGIILHWNPGAQAIFGYAGSEIIGQNIEIVMPKSTRDASHDGLKQLDLSETSQLSGTTIEVAGLHKSGKVLPLELSFSTWKIDQDAFFSVIVRDITDRKKTEDALREAKASAEELARLKAEFLANMSHEIRTPLNAIMGMTGLLLETPMTAEQRDYSETIRNSSDGLLEIINTILDFSKIEAGKLVLEKHPFNLRGCVESALDLVATDAARKGLNVAYRIEESTPNKLIGDDTRIRQILVNLLANAVKFTNAGEVVLSVYAIQTSGQNFDVHFSVRDTGIGIPAERKEMLFQSFSQLDASTTRKYGGTGLGLSICKQLIDAMGGDIQVESEEGLGSVFSFWIPARALPETSNLVPTGKQPELQGKRILIVDGNATNIQILSNQTRSWGMEPSAYTSGVEALKAFQNGAIFDIVILDQDMPEMDGGTLVRELRTLSRSTPTPLVILSSLGSHEGSRGKSRDLFNHTLIKPIKPAVLFDVLKNAFEKRPALIQEPLTPEAVKEKVADNHPLRILLAEDNPVNQKVAIKILEQMGYRVDLAANGLEVLSALERQPYDLVLMDIQMPEMDGEQTTRNIRNHFLESRQPRIVAMTAHTMPGDRDRYIAAGMEDFISKPVKVDELVKVLQETPSTVIPKAD
jgi:PAS domain S-box-containing protein